MTLVDNKYTHRKQKDSHETAIGQRNLHPEPHKHYASSLDKIYLGDLSLKFKCTSLISNYRKSKTNIKQKITRKR